MRTLRIYTPTELQVGHAATLTDSAFKHLTEVLRTAVNDNVTLFNGDGYDYRGTVQQIEKKSCSIDLSDRVLLTNESPLRIHLLQSICKSDRMDYCIQKATELGVSSITPVITQHGNVKHRGDRATKKHNHWQGVMTSACEQSGRATLPELQAIATLAETLTVLAKDSSDKIVLAPNAKKSLKSYSVEREIYLLIGPEGGLAADEIALAEHNGFTTLSMGPRILRVETACSSAIASLQLLHGDWS